MIGSSESQLVGEVLFVLQGVETAHILFDDEEDKIVLSFPFTLLHVTSPRPNLPRFTP